MAARTGELAHSEQIFQSDRAGGMRSQEALKIEGELRRKRIDSPGGFDLAWERDHCGDGFHSSPEPPGIGRSDESAAEVPCLRLRPADEAAGFETIFIHGGGFCLLSAYLYSRMAGHFANHLKGEVLLPDYSLAPESPYPAALNQCASVVSSRIRSAGVPVALAGDSAGGNLALAVMMLLRDQGNPLPFAAVLLAPWLDLTMSGDSNVSAADDDLVLTPAALCGMAEFYLQGHRADAPYVSPLFGDLSGLPPVLVQASEWDLLRDDSHRLLEAESREPGLQVKTCGNMLHAFQFYAGQMPEADEALAEAAAFLHRSLPG